MTVSYLGGLSVGAAAPGAAVAVDAGLAAGVAGLAPLLDQLAALTAYVPTPISFSAQLTVAQAIVDGLGAAISGGITPPSIDVQLAALAAAIAALQTVIDGINAQLAVLTDLQAPLAEAGVHGYAFDGTVSAFGAELSAELAGGVPGGSPSDHGNAVVFITTLPATWAAMGEIFKVAP